MSSSTPKHQEGPNTKQAREYAIRQTEAHAHWLRPAVEAAIGRELSPQEWEMNQRSFYMGAFRAAEDIMDSIDRGNAQRN